MKLETTFCGVKFKNPLVLASGVLGVTGASLRYVVENGAGGVTTKSIWRYGHQGHPNPVIIAKDRKSTRLNSSHLKLSRMPSSA